MEIQKIKGKISKISKTEPSKVTKENSYHKSMKKAQRQMNNKMQYVFVYHIHDTAMC